MKIGVVGSGNDMLVLFRELHKYQHQYFVVYDFLYWPYGDKGFEFVLERVKYRVEELVKQGVERVIVPPVYELALRSDVNFAYRSMILPLFYNYLMEQCFAGALVGKVGLIGDFSDLEKGQSLMKEMEKEYVLSASQSNIKKFLSPFAYWTKEIMSWKYFLQTFSYSDFMVNKKVKQDLRYFKDANVDTVVPLHYCCFQFQKTICGFLNLKKIKFHKFEKLFLGFEKFEESTYGVKVLYTGHVKFLEREKKLMWLLARGKEVKIVFVLNQTGK